MLFDGFAKQALARLLREDARKGDAGQLCVSLLAAFLALSHVPAAHPLLQQVGLCACSGLQCMHYA